MAGHVSVSHDLPKLVELMGGGDAFCEKLNYAFEQARPTDFVHAYSGGYVAMLTNRGALMRICLLMADSHG